MILAVFEPAVPPGERPQTHALDRAAPGIGSWPVYTKLNLLAKLNSVALVRTRTIPTERPPPVGEVSANFCG